MARTEPRKNSGPTHADLVGIGVAWARRTRSRGGPACDLVLYEPGAGFGQESPDVIGWKLSGPDGGSVVVEAKASRADFLADRKKPHREGPGLGNWRYYLCPEGLIQPDECPAGWGLLYAGARRRVTVMAGPLVENHTLRRSEALRDWRLEADMEAERRLLVAWLRRVESPESSNRLIRMARQDAATWGRAYEKEYEERKKVSHRLMTLQLAIDHADDSAPGIREQVNTALAAFEQGDRGR